MGWDPFNGWTPDQTPTPEDVNRRQALAKTLLSNTQPAQNWLGVLANGLSGYASAALNDEAAKEETAGRNASNAQIAQLLAPGAPTDPGAMIAAAGNGFMNDTQSGLVGDLFKRKLGIGETFYGTPIVTTDAQGHVHLYQPGSQGDTREMSFGGNTVAPQQTFLNTGTGWVPTAKNAGVVLPGTPPGGNGDGSPVPLAPLPSNPYDPTVGDRIQQIQSGPQANSVDFTSAPSAAATIPIQNEQKASDTARGTAEGSQIANAPINLQAEQQGLQQLDNQYQTAKSAVQDALGAANNFTTGTLGSVLNAVPGTPQYDLKQRLTTLQAIIGFQTLQAIRNASKTGGGLGSISDFEERLLSSVQGSMDQGQSPDQFKRNLNSLLANLDQLNQQAHQNYQQDFDRSKGMGANLNQVPSPTNSPAQPSNNDPLGIR